MLRLLQLPMSYLQLLFPFFLLPTLCRANGGWGVDVDGRHSFSLSTFDPTGKLGQVDYAAEAAAFGTPVVAVATHRGVFLASPQVLPSPLIRDDGTARFSRVTSTILVAHSGLSADGRVLVEAAQQMAVQHEYAYDENIPIDIFLEELALKFQEYTMKPGSRPFGVTLVVAHLPPAGSGPPMLFRIDPSGSVTSMGSYAVVNGSNLQTDDKLLDRLKDIASTSSSSPEALRTKLAGAVEDALRRSVGGNNLHQGDGETKAAATTLPANLRRILTASIHATEGMVLDQYALDLSSSSGGVDL